MSTIATNSQAEPKRKEDVRAQILRSALLVLHRLGARSFTLDAVAREAGVSKGGLIHYFPNREALIAGMFKHVHARFEESFQRFLAEEPQEPGRRTRAYIRANFQVMEEGSTPYVLSLFELMAVEPAVLQSLKTRDRDVQAILANDGLNPAYSAVLTSSCDACWLGVSFGFMPLKSRRLRSMREQLLAMTREPYAQWVGSDE